MRDANSNLNPSDRRQTIAARSQAAAIRAASLAGTNAAADPSPVDHHTAHNDPSEQDAERWDGLS
jgi:hypothetical protein